jgi:hypothetical protein
MAWTWVERIEPRSDDVGLGGKFRERQHDAGVSGLIVLDDQFGLLAQDAAGLLTASSASFAPLIA